MAAPTGSTSGAAGAVGLARTDVASMFAARRTADSIAAETGSPDSPSECGRIDVERTQGIWVLTLRDDHDVSTQPSLREQLEMVAHAGGPIVVDLCRATFIDGTVIGAIALASTRHERAGASLTLVAPANYIGTRMVELVGIGSTIPVYRTRAEAVTAHLGEIGEDVVERDAQVAGGDATAGSREAAHGGPADDMMASDR